MVSLHSFWAIFWQMDFDFTMELVPLTQYKILYSKRDSKRITWYVSGLSSELFPEQLVSRRCIYLVLQFTQQPPIYYMNLLGGVKCYWCSSPHFCFIMSFLVSDGGLRTALCDINKMWSLLPDDRKNECSNLQNVPIQGKEYPFFLKEKCYSWKFAGNNLLCTLLIIWRSEMITL